jgi:hypothetical protein
MWEPQPLATLRASTACYRDNFTFTVEDEAELQLRSIIRLYVKQEVNVAERRGK